MERSAPPRNGDPSRSSIGNHYAWCLLLLALLAWQSWMTLTLFGGEQPWKNVLDDRPILSGRHPLHLYHGYLGARALREHGCLSCYDPTFHAGYPKTPIFDSGSRPAELALALAGGNYCPAAYKIGVALVCAAVPLCVYLAARGVGMKRAAACLACALSLLVWWGQPCSWALESGDIDLLLAMLMGLAQAGLLIRFHADPGPFSWLGIVAATMLGCFAQPLLMALLIPLFLIYYLSVGARHQLTWHLALWIGLLGAVAVNSFWLMDWISYWWVRVPPHVETPLLTEPTWRSVWEAPFWGGPFDKGLACALVLASVAGVILYNRSGQRATARLFGLSVAVFLTLTVAGLIWEPLGRFGSRRLLLPALLFAAVPASHALSVSLAASWRRRAGRWLSLLAAAVVGVLLWRIPPPIRASWAKRFQDAGSLQLGLGPGPQAIVEALQQHTTTEARILWEDSVDLSRFTNWPSLLTLLTQREYIGGLDADVRIEHTTNGLVYGILMGRPIRDWSDEALSEYCKRYNIGWVVCWSPAACERLHNWSKAIPIAKFFYNPTIVFSNGDIPPGYLFAVRREGYSYALTGSARWLSADTQRIVLGDVVPPHGGSDNRGKRPIVLSLHYQAGMRVAPSRVVLDSCSIERVTSVPGDARPFVRLWIDEPVTRVTISWDKR